jgi:predicted metalloprotease with PDZ domain
MILEPNARLGEPDEFDMSGAAIMADGPDYTVVKVVRVRPESPAAQAGLEPDDRIVSVDGQATSLTVNRLKRMFRVEREYLVKVKRGERILELKLKLRRLI